MFAASSKSFTPQISFPAASIQVPKFSTWASPTESAVGAAANSFNEIGITFAQRKNVARRKTNGLCFIRSCL